jgi:hypothetical protein
LSQPVAARLRVLGQATHCQRGHLIDRVGTNGRRYCGQCRGMHQRNWEIEHREERATKRRLRARGEV